MKSYVRKKKIIDLDLLRKTEWKLESFDLEITARCNLSCRHCYIGLPAVSKKANDELSSGEIAAFVNDAVGLGALTCLITGGEPLLRKDFLEIYLNVKRKGLLTTVFTNGTLLTDEHISVFKKYPPRFIELTVYGASEETYEKITQVPGSYKAFLQGLSLLQKNDIPFRLKSIAIRSNLHEQQEIRSFCIKQCKEPFRFDPFLHLSFNSERRNKEIAEERLTPEEVVELESTDPKRYSCIENSKEKLILPHRATSTSNNLFSCGAGLGKLVLGYNGLLRLCESLTAPDCVYDIRNGSLEEAMNTFVPQVRSKTSNRSEYMKKCRICPIINLCLWCPAHAYLETGEMDAPVDYFCEIAHARRRMLDNNR